MSTTVSSFAEIEPHFVRTIRDTVYSTMVTVDRQGRPRARVLIAVWEVIDGRPRGWLATFRTPVKAAHLAANPHATFSYWNPRQDAAFVDTVATWVDDPEVRADVWELYRRGSPSGVGYDPRPYWPAGPDAANFHVLALEPWRIHVVHGRDLRNVIWRPDPRVGDRGSQPGRATNT